MTINPRNLTPRELWDAGRDGLPACRRRFVDGLSVLRGYASDRAVQVVVAYLALLVVTVFALVALFGNLLS